MSGIGGFPLLQIPREGESDIEDSKKNLHSLIQLALTERKLPNIALLEASRDRYALSQGDCSLSLGVQWQVFHASHADITEEGWIEQGLNFGFEHLSSVDIVDLYAVLNHYKEIQGEKSLFSNHLFDITDHLLRRCIHSKSDGEAILSQIEAHHDDRLLPLLQKIQALAPKGVFVPIFHKLIKKSEDIVANHWSDFKIVKREAEPRSIRRLKVVKVALETSRNAVGGLGAVLKASAAAHRALDYETVHGIHAFYVHDKTRIPAQFKGVILHEYKGEMIESSVYKDTETGDYLIQPPLKYRSLFDVRSTAQIYTSHSRSSREDRSLYLASASAAFIALYSGPDGNEAVDVVQGDGHHVAGPLFELMATRIDHMVKEAGLYRSARTYLTHMLTPCPIEQGTVDTSKFDLIGVNTQGYDSTVNATASALIHSDTRIYVSKGVRNDALDPGAGKHGGLRTALLTPGRETVFRGEIDIHGLTNGIDTSLFDICNPKEFRHFTLQPSCTGAGNPSSLTMDFAGHQASIKAILAEQGLIGDPKKPLFLFVGRYSSEKGIDMLPAMVKTAIQNGGQCVIMGLKCDDSSSLEIIDELQELANNPPFKGMLKVYKDREDQMGTLKIGDDDTGVRKGWLLRASASVVMVPSHAEACGLVPMEAHCTGAMVIAPKNQGLIDMCVPIVTDDNTGRSPFTGGNSFMYENHESIEEACDAVKRASDFIHKLSQDELNRYMESTHEYALSTYGWINRRASEGIVSGTAVNYSRVYHDTYQRLHPSIEDVESSQEAFIRAMNTREAESKTAQSIAVLHKAPALTRSDDAPGSKADEMASLEIAEPLIARSAPSTATLSSTLDEAGKLTLTPSFLDMVDADRRAECLRLLELANTLPENTEFDKTRMLNGIRDLFAKSSKTSTLISLEPSIDQSSFYKDANQLLASILPMLIAPLTIKAELTLFQLAQAGELCSRGIIDSLQQCCRLIRNEKEGPLKNFVQVCFDDFHDALFDSIYTSFLKERSDSSHPRVALRQVFDRIIPSPSAAETQELEDFSDDFLDLEVFPEFTTEATREDLRRDLTALYNPTAALMHLSRKLQHNSDRREQFIEWCCHHIPTTFINELLPEEIKEYTALPDDAERDQWLRYQFLMKKVYNDSGQLQPEIILFFLRENKLLQR